MVQVHFWCFCISLCKWDSISLSPISRLLHTCLHAYARSPSTIWYTNFLGLTGFIYQIHKKIAIFNTHPWFLVFKTRTVEESKVESRRISNMQGLGKDKRCILFEEKRVFSRVDKSSSCAHNHHKHLKIRFHSFEQLGMWILRSIWLRKHWA